MHTMRRVIAASVFLVIVISIAVTAYADSLSTYKIIRITLRVVSESEIEDNYKTVVKRTVDEVDEEPAFDIVYSGYWCQRGE